MKSFGFRALTLGCVFMAMLVACSGSEPPTGAPIGGPQTLLEADAPGASGRTRGAVRGALLYVIGGEDVTNIVAYPSGKVSKTLFLGTGVGGSGACSHAAGHVFITASKQVGGGAIVGYIFAYAHGGTSPIYTIDEAANNAPSGCSVDPTSGNLAVTNNPRASCVGGGNVAIYLDAKGTPTTYTDSSFTCYSAAAYDDRGNLFVGGMGSGSGSSYIIAELPKGASQFINISIDTAIACQIHDAVCNDPIQWNGTYLTISKPAAGHSSPIVYQVSISGSNGTVIGTTKFKGAFRSQSGEGSWIQGRRIILTYHVGSVGVWSYPAGGKTIQLIKGLRVGREVGLIISS